MQHVRFSFAIKKIVLNLCIYFSAMIILLQYLAMQILEKQFRLLILPLQVFSQKLPLNCDVRVVVEFELNHCSNETLL